MIVFSGPRILSRERANQRVLLIDRCSTHPPKQKLRDDPASRKLSISHLDFRQISRPSLREGIFSQLATRFFRARSHCFRLKNGEKIVPSRGEN